MTGTLVTRRLSWKTSSLIVESISGSRNAGGSSRRTSAAQPSVRLKPLRECRARVRSQRWHSASAPGGSGGMYCISPQSAQVIVISGGSELVQDMGPGRGQGAGGGAQGLVVARTPPAPRALRSAPLTNHPSPSSLLTDHLNDRPP